MLGRIRSVKPELFLDEELSALPVEARYLLIGIHCHADRAGRFEWRASRLRALIYPYETQIDVAGLLEQLRKARFLLRYESGGAVFGYVRNWTKQQVINNRERESELPTPPDEEDAHASGAAASVDAPSSGDVAADQVATSKPAKKPAKKAADPGPLYEGARFVLNTGEEWQAPQRLVDTLREAYRGVQVEEELLKAAAWTLANATNRKTRNGMAAFLQRWVARAQDDSTKRPRQASQTTPSGGGSRFAPLTPNFGDGGE